jgi:hypothetical protein
LALLTPDYGYGGGIESDAVGLGWLRRKGKVVIGVLWIFGERLLREGIFWIFWIGLFVFWNGGRLGLVIVPGYAVVGWTYGDLG